MKGQDKTKKKKKQIDWEERLFLVASQFLSDKDESNSNQIYFLENHMTRAKSFLRQYRKLYEAGEFDDVIT